MSCLRLRVMTVVFSMCSTSVMMYGIFPGKQTSTPPSSPELSKYHSESNHVQFLCLASSRRALQETDPGPTSRHLLQHPSKASSSSAARSCPHLLTPYSHHVFLTQATTIRIREGDALLSGIFAIVPG